MKHVHRRITTFSCLALAFGERQVLTPERCFTHLSRAPGYGTFLLGTIQMSLWCSKHGSRLTPPFLPPEGGGLLAVCHPPHIRAPFPGWHLLALPASVQCLTVSHHRLREAVVCGLTSGAPGSALGGSKTCGVGKEPLTFFSAQGASFR